MLFQTLPILSGTSIPFLTVNTITGNNAFLPALIYTI